MVKLKFRLSDEGQQKFTRADTLGENYTAEKITKQIEQIQRAQAVIERLAVIGNAKGVTFMVLLRNVLKPRSYKQFGE